METENTEEDRKWHPWETLIGQVAGDRERQVCATEIESEPEEENGFPIREWPILQAGQETEKLNVLECYRASWWSGEHRWLQTEEQWRRTCPHESLLHIQLIPSWL